MKEKKYWEEKHIDYSKADWIEKPTIFAQFSIKYFPKSGVLLDLGAGQGQDSRYFSKLGYTVTSTDFSNNALKFAKEKAKRRKLKISYFNLDHSRKLPFKDGPFDIVYSHLSLHYFDNLTTEKLFNEIYRVLKPKGVFATLLNTIDDPETKIFEKVEKGLYKNEYGIIKRYFSLDYLNSVVKENYKILIMDKKGETYKDTIKTLVRFIGKKKNPDEIL